MSFKRKKLLFGIVLSGLLVSSVTVTLASCKTNVNTGSDNNVTTPPETPENKLNNEYNPHISDKLPVINFNVDTAKLHDGKKNIKMHKLL